MNASAPTVSVILPTHNRAHTLARAIDSVLAQTYRDFELIVVDDASSDATPELMAGYDDPRVRLYSLKQRGGQCVARNAGLRVAKGRYIAFQDSDDEWHDNKLGRQMAAFVRTPDPSCTACFCRRILVGEGTEPRIYPQAAARRLQGSLFRLLLQQSLIATPTLIVEKASLEQVGGFDEALSRWVDWDLVLRLAREHRFLFVDETLVISHHSPDSIHGVADHGPTVRIIGKHLASYRADSQLARKAGGWLWYAGVRLLMQGRIREGRQALGWSIELSPGWRHWLVSRASRLAPQSIGFIAAAWAKWRGKALLP